MSNWADIKIYHIKPKPKKEEGIDWLDIVEKSKKECKIKTIALPRYLLQTVKKYHISDKTDLNRII